MSKCKHCGSEQIQTVLLEEYVDDLMGAPFQVVLERAVMQSKCGSCGRVLGVAIPDLEGLIAAVAMTRAFDPEKLSGDEVRFMRKALGWKAKELAEFLEITPEHLSRCESGSTPLSNGLEKYLRHYACEKIKRRFILGIDFDFEMFERMRIRPRLVVPPRQKKYRFVRVRVKVEQKKNADGWDVKPRKAA